MMRQLGSIIKKDFKLLLRTKSSTLAVLVGPLLVIFLVGLVFANAGEEELVVGLVYQDFPNVESYVESLEGAFVTIPYDSDDACVEDVRRGRLVSCVSLRDASPPQAVISVDPSDVNVVYAVIDRVTGQLENQTSVLRQGLAAQLLDAVTRTSYRLRADYEELAQVRLLLDQQEDNAQSLARDLQELRIDVQVVSRGDVRDAIDGSVNARDDFRDIAEEALEGLDDAADRHNDSRAADLRDDLFDRFDAVNDDLDDTGEQVFAELLTSVEELEDEIDRSAEAAQALSAQANSIRNSIGTAAGDVEVLLARVGEARDTLGTLDISSQELTRPLDPVISPVTAEQDSFGFVLPYFLVLIIMFTSVLLASTVIVRERNSSAYFRNFTTPTPEWLFVISTFLTTLLVVVVQLIIIFVVASFFTATGELSQVPAALVIILCIVTVFSLLGMLLGYVFRSQEGVMLASIATTSLLLFVSDLVLPVETIPGALQAVINANPLVLASELLKGVLLFGFGLGTIAKSLGVLVLYSVVMFALIMIVQRLARIRYFELAGTRARISKFIGQEDIPEGKELEIGEWIVANKEELVQALKMMSDEEYEEYASLKKNRLADWVLDVYKDDSLARRLKNKSRKGAISVLERDLKS